MKKEMMVTGFDPHTRILELTEKNRKYTNKGPEYFNLSIDDKKLIEALKKDGCENLYSIDSKLEYNENWGPDVYKKSRETQERRKQLLKKPPKCPFCRGKKVNLAHYHFNVKWRCTSCGNSWIEPGQP